jgi:hypothetical protein
MLLIYPLPTALLLMSVGTVMISNVTQDLTQLGGLCRGDATHGGSGLSGGCRRPGRSALLSRALPP